LVSTGLSRISLYAAKLTHPSTLAQWRSVQ
jgi:hypothetical protein